MRRWKEKHDRREDIPDSIDDTLEEIDKGTYVNINTTLQLLITIPIQSSASCGPSKLRITTVQDGLNRLTLIHGHRELEQTLNKL